MKNLSSLLIILLCFLANSEAVCQTSIREFYELKLYHLENEEYQNNVSHIDAVLLRATGYSGI
ncbi:hypothetical protein [Salinimicrobium sp. GXAS 041]|uniref:hypothetical protein n=1 Tax=Salinimicrobium sp. GXAS 041 TaxID=3400806 RepID=UPI003C754FF3